MNLAQIKFNLFKNKAEESKEAKEYFHSISFHKKCIPLCITFTSLPALLRAHKGQLNVIKLH